MPQFYFHFWRKSMLVPDPDGVQLRDLRAAHRHANRLAESTAEMTASILAHGRWAIEVVDDEGQLVLTVLVPVWPYCHSFRRVLERA